MSETTFSKEKLSATTFSKVKVVRFDIFLDKMLLALNITGEKIFLKFIYEEKFFYDFLF